MDKATDMAYSFLLSQYIDLIHLCMGETYLHKCLCKVLISMWGETSYKSMCEEMSNKGSYIVLVFMRV